MQALSVFRITRRLRHVAVRHRLIISLAIIVLASVVVSQRLVAAPPPPPSSVDLSTYALVGRFDLPEPTRTAAPPNSLLAQEASGVTYNWDTDSLFVIADHGTSVVQVTKTGVLIDSMTLALGGSPQGTEFYDTEGITYVGGGQFVLTEERYRQASLFTYVGGGTLERSDVSTVKLGTTIGNVGIEGLSYDPQTGGFIFVKEKDPQSIFQSGIDFVTGTATNGSAATINSTNLFNPPLANLEDMSDVFALSNLPSLTGQPDASHLLVISQESGQIIKIDRNGSVSSKMTITADAGSLLSVPDMTMEGITMDRDGVLYLVNEQGGGDANHPQLWVYAPSGAANLPPAAITLHNPVNSIPENTNVALPIRLAGIVVTDDGLGNNNLSVGGADASSFQIIGTGLYLKAGTPLNATTKPSYDITVLVNDPAVGGSPDASMNYSLAVTAVVGGQGNLRVTEASPWSSTAASSPLAADWFEVTNVGTATQSLTGWTMDDDSNTAGIAALNGVPSIAPGESVIFIEVPNGTPTAMATSGANAAASFRLIWFNNSPPANLQIGYYGGSGVGLGNGGDQVNLFDNGVKKTGVTFGASTGAAPFRTFDNAGLLENTTTPPGTLSAANWSAVGVNGAFVAATHSTEVGSPGTIGTVATTPEVNITATDAAAAEAGTDPGTFHITRTGSTVGALSVNYTIAVGASQATSDDYTPPALTGVITIGSGQSFVDIVITPVDDGLFELPETVTLTLSDTGNSDVGPNATATVTIADNDPPATSIDSAPTNPTASTSATLEFSVINPGSGSATFECSLDGSVFGTCSSPLNYLALTDGSHTFSVRAVDASDASNIGATVSATWTVDSTAPSITGSRTPAANAAGWNNTAVTVTFSCADVDGTGISSCGPSPQVVSTEGAGQSSTGTAVDNVGNVASATVSGISIDFTPPTIGTCPASGPYPFSVPQMLSVNVTDSLSGPTAATISLAADVRPGARALTFVASDIAGNTASKICHYEVTVMAAMQQVLTEINAAIPGASDRDARRLTRAAKLLNEALDPRSWKNGNQIDPRKALKVFASGLLSIEALTEIVLDRRSGIADATVKGWIRILARSLKELGS